MTLRGLRPSVTSALAFGVPSIDCRRSRLGDGAEERNRCVHVQNMGSGPGQMERLATAPDRVVRPVLRVTGYPFIGGNHGRVDAKSNGSDCGNRDARDRMRGRRDGRRRFRRRTAEMRPRVQRLSVSANAAQRRLQLRDGGAFVRLYLRRLPARLRLRRGWVARGVEGHGTGGVPGARSVLPGWGPRGSGLRHAGRVVRHRMQRVQDAVRRGSPLAPALPPAGIRLRLTPSPRLYLAAAAKAFAPLPDRASTLWTRSRNSC
jgi:hypothetical protein